MFCINCGKELPDGQTVCPNCGAQVKSSAGNASDPVDAAQPSQPTPESSVSSGSGAQTSSSAP